jgi:hypothetical protein
VSLPEALYRHIPGAYQISVRISPRHPSHCNNYYLGTQFWQNLTTQGYHHIPSSIARSCALCLSSEKPSPG